MNEHGDDWRSKLDEEAAPGVLPEDLNRAREPGRGREANTPGQIPARGWKDILWRVLWGISEDRILSTSGGVAFFALLAVFPAIATIVSLYGLFADTSMIRSHLSLLTGILPGGVLELIGEQISLIATQGSDTLSVAFMIGFLVALWSANSGVAALFDALNVVYGEKEKRSLVRFYATTFLITLGMIGFIILAICAVVVAPVVLTFVGFATPAEQLLAILRWPLLLVVVGAWLAVIYRYGPSRRDPKWRWVTWGSVTAAVLWLAASMLFSWYVANFDSYNKTYGSLGAGVGFMVWIWLSVVILLLGADLNAEMEHQRLRRNLGEQTSGGPVLGSKFRQRAIRTAGQGRLRIAGVVRLLFAHHVDHLDAAQDRTSAVHRLEPKHRPHPSLDGPMILLNPVIQVAALTNADPLLFRP